MMSTHVSETLRSNSKKSSPVPVLSIDSIDKCQEYFQYKDTVLGLCVREFLQNLTLKE